MAKAVKMHLSFRWMALFLMLSVLLALPLTVLAETGGRQIVSGPVSLSLRGGGENNSGAIGLDGRVDYLNQLLNLHLFGTVDLLDGAHGEGRIDNKRYGAGIAFSHTFARKANVFAGTSFIREMNENFGHAYLGGKLKLTEYALLSASYGFGFDHVKEIQKHTSRFVLAEAVDWLKAGTVLVNSQGWKANLYYYLTDPGDQQISGIEGELSYPVLDNLTLGINGSCDLREKDVLERNWRSFFFVTYAFGGQKASPVDVALDKNNPAEYPKIIRTTAIQTVSSNILSISPLTSNSTGCSGGSVTLTATGGVPPYKWTSSEGGTTNLSNFTANSVTWQDTSDNWCGQPGTVTVTVTDSQFATANATINVLNLPN